MANVRTLQRSFAGGEMSPEMFGRIDDVKYQSGAAKMLNFIATPQGPAENRPGFEFVREVKDSTKKVRLIPFTYNTTQTMVIEMGDLYMRFHTQGGTLLADELITNSTFNSNITGWTDNSTQIGGVGASVSWRSNYGGSMYMDYTKILGSDCDARTRTTVTIATATNYTINVKNYGSSVTVKVGSSAGGTQYGSFTTSLSNGVYTGSLTVSLPIGTTHIEVQTNLADAYLDEVSLRPTAATPYEITTPYVQGDLFDIHYVQSADVITLVHPNYAPRELKRLSANNWTLTSIDFNAPIAAPSAPTVTTSGGTTTKYDYYYVVTAIASDDISESAASSSGTVKSNLFETGCINTITWSAVTGALRYRVYKQQGGVYGYIGQTTGTSIIDDNIAPDMGTTPPIYNNDFTSSGNYPGAVSYFEQRRCFAGTTNEPQKIWMTRSGTESTMSYSLPSKDDDRIEFRVAAREANTIRHIVPLTQLILLTAAAEWRVSSVNSDAITPDSISVRPQSYVGSNNVQPQIINNSMVYCAARGGHVRELGYSWQANGFITGDLSLRASHLFDNLDITDMCYSKAPRPLLWFISTSGKLLGFTYIPEQQVGSWHQHDTDGVFESCTAVAEGNEDRLYVVVKRTINGSTKRYVERMASRQFTELKDCFFVDSGLTYSGTPASTISGLSHLEGKTVSILADGAVHPQRVVSSGSITLDRKYSKVTVGLPYNSDLQTLPVALQIDGFGQGRYKNINKAWLRVYQSSGIFVGPTADKLVEAKQRTTEDYGTPPALKSQEILVMLTPAWADSGQVYVRQKDPLPLSIVSMTIEVAVGG